jgi:hypothetical protein
VIYEICEFFFVFCFVYVSICLLHPCRIEKEPPGREPLAGTGQWLARIVALGC